MGKEIEMREIEVKFVVERDGVKYLSRPYLLDEDGLPSHEEVLENMEGDCTCDLNESTNYCDGSCSEWETAKVVDYVQATGKEDENGKDIYGDDVLLDEEFGLKYIVCWGDDDEFGTGWRISTIPSSHIYRFDNSVSKLEIIGTIHDNPDKEA